MTLNRIYSVIAILLLLSSCDCRTPSKDRFEEVTGLYLNDEVTVKEDRFEESGQDYGLFYQVSLNEKDCLELVKKIQESKQWINDKNDWKFNKTLDGIIYSIVFSTNECQISYNEDLI